MLELLLEDKLLVDSDDGVEPEDWVLTELGVSLAIVLELDELLDSDEEVLRSRYVELLDVEDDSELEVLFSNNVELESEDWVLLVLPLGLLSVLLLDEELELLLELVLVEREVFCR